MKQTPNEALFDAKLELVYDQVNSLVLSNNEDNETLNDTNDGVIDESIMKKKILKNHLLCKKKKTVFEDHLFSKNQ